MARVTGLVTCLLIWVFNDRTFFHKFLSSVYGRHQGLIDGVFRKIGMSEGHDVLLELRFFHLMTDCAVFRSYRQMNFLIIVIEYVTMIVGIDGMALSATYHDFLQLIRNVLGGNAPFKLRAFHSFGGRNPGVCASSPVSHYYRRDGTMAGDAILSQIAQGLIFRVRYGKP
jgi:hypothetical protein